MCHCRKTSTRIVGYQVANALAFEYSDELCGSIDLTVGSQKVNVCRVGTGQDKVHKPPDPDIVLR